MYKLQNFPNKLHCSLFTFIPSSTAQQNMGAITEKENSFFCFAKTFDFESSTTADLNTMPSVFNNYFSKRYTIFNH